MAGTITWKTKGSPKKGQKTRSLQEPKKGDRLALVIGSYHTHSPSNVKQIMGFSSNRRFRINISGQCHLPFYSEGQSMLKSNIDT